MHRKLQLNPLNFCYIFSIVHFKTCIRMVRFLSHTMGIAWYDARFDLKFDPNDDGWYD
jgi:hypothetical protein